MQNTIVASNIVVFGGHPTDGDPAMKFQERIDGLSLLGNQIYVEPDMAVGNVCLSIVEGTGGNNHRTLVSGNLCVRGAVAEKITAKPESPDVRGDFMSNRPCQEFKRCVGKKVAKAKTSKIAAACGHAP